MNRERLFVLVSSGIGGGDPEILRACRAGSCSAKNAGSAVQRQPGGQAPADNLPGDFTDGRVDCQFSGIRHLKPCDGQCALDDTQAISNRITHDFRDPQLIDLTFEVALADLKRRILGVEEAADLEGDIAPLHPSGPRHGPFPEELSVEKQKVRLIGIPELPGDVVPVPIRDCKLLNGGALTKVWERGAAGEQPS